MRNAGFGRGHLIVNRLILDVFSKFLTLFSRGFSTPTYRSI